MRITPFNLGPSNKHSYDIKTWMEYVVLFLQHILRNIFGYRREYRRKTNTYYQ